MAGALFGLGAVTGPLLGPTRRRLAHRRLELALDLPRQRARSASLAACARLHASSRSRASRRRRRRSTRFGIGAARRGHGVAPVRARGGQPRRLVREPDASCVLAVVAAIALVTFVVHELETDAPGRRPPRLQEPQLHRRHRAQLPHRHRALRRLVPVLALLRHGHALHGARHRACSSSSRQLDPDRHHAAGRAAHRQGRRARAHRLRDRRRASSASG